MHMVTMPYFTLRRSISRRIVAVSFAPVHPSGCPSAMAPPLTLTRSAFRPDFANHGQRLHSEGLVQFDEADVIELQTG